MTFEFHVTVEETSIIDWIKVCKRMGFKPLVIRLSEGEHAEQFMCSVRVSGDENVRNHYQNWLYNFFSSVGLTVKRMKIEIPLSEYDNWLRDYQEGGQALYSECHIKVKTNDMERLLKLSDQSSLPISYSMLNGHVWLTFRLKSASDWAKEQFDGKLTQVKWWGFGDATMHTEAVLCDTNPELDAGWVICV